MDTTKQNNGHLLIFRGTDWHEGLSPAEIQSVMGEWTAWYERLGKEGKVSGGNPLERDGRIVSGAARTVSDGPFAESKETVGGYFFLTVRTMDEAVEIARECPALPYGIKVEVRPVAHSCPASQMVREAEAAMA